MWSDNICVFLFKAKLLGFVVAYAKLRVALSTCYLLEKQLFLNYWFPQLINVKNEQLFCFVFLKKT